MQQPPPPPYLLLCLGLLAACGDKKDSGHPSTLDTGPDTAQPDTGTGPGEPAISQCADGTTGFITAPEGAIHVWAAAPADGDGSWAAPFAELQPALDLARTGSADKHIAVWPGQYSANLRLSATAGDDGTSIQGCSPDEVVISAADAGQPVILVTEAVDILLTGLCTDGGTRNIQVWSDASVSLANLRSTGGAEAGLVIHGGATYAALSEVEVWAPVPSEAGFGYGIAIQEGASLDMSGGGVWDATGAGVLVDDAGQVSFEGITVEGTVADGDGAWGHGLQVQADTVQVALAGAEFSTNQGAGVFVLQGISFSMSGTHIDSTAASTIPDSAARSGDGVVISRGAGNLNPATFSAQLDGNTIDGSERAGILIDGVTAVVSGNTLAGNGFGADLALSQGPAVVSGSDTVTPLADEQALDLNLTALAAIDPGAL